MCVRCPAALCSDLQAEWFVIDSPLRSSRLLVCFPLRVGPWDPHLFTHMMRLLPTQRTVVRCPLLHTHRCIEQMPKLHFASNLFCLLLTQQPRCPSHISVASAWQCGLHRSDRMFHRTHAGAYVHFSRILPNGEKTVVGTHRSGKHNLQHPYAPKFPIFHEKNGKKWPLFGQKLSFSASDKQLKTPRPILRVLDAKKQVLERDRSRKHNLQHTFFMKKRPRMAVFGQKLSFSASDKHLKTPPPYFEGAGCEKAGSRQTQITKTQFTACICTNICHFS